MMTMWMCKKLKKIEKNCKNRACAFEKKYFMMTMWMCKKLKKIEKNNKNRACVFEKQFL